MAQLKCLATHTEGNSSQARYNDAADNAVSHRYINGHRGETLGIRLFNAEGEELAYRFYGMPPFTFDTPRKWS